MGKKSTGFLHISKKCCNFAQIFKAMQKLIGREREIKELERCLASEQSEFVIVYGRRRVGKTFLVDEFFHGKYDFTYVGGHKLSVKKQLHTFARPISNG